MTRKKPDNHAPAVVITGIQPALEGGRHAVKMVEGGRLDVTATVFKDGHDVISVVMMWRRDGEEMWNEVPMRDEGNDRWSASQMFPEPAIYEYTVGAWPNAEATWLHGLQRKVEAGVPDLDLELEEGALWLREASLRARRAKDRDASRDLMQMAEVLPTLPPHEAVELMSGGEARALAMRWSDRRLFTVPERPHLLLVERRLAAFSAWYEFFPRNALGDGRTHATFSQCTRVLQHARGLGFDVVYLPPVHPIGITHRKGKNNSTTAQPGEIGSPWAIGGPDGGHREIEPALGTMEDFRNFVEEARSLGLETAMDFALQCSPDHPWVKEHPEWFRHRPDGSIQYAENPPKKYQDIYPIDFHNPDWQALWREVRDVLLFWCSQGVRIFRVDNPHTKPVAMWEWVLREVRRRHGDVVFLSEAFTRPAMMHELGKIGFSQSYSYFTWRLTKDELRGYVEELRGGEVPLYMRANFWPNTPDILAYELWHAPPAKFKIRATLAATLMPNWGMYSGFEFCENEPMPPKEEYLDSEKYQLRERDWGASGICAHIATLNSARRRFAALQENGRLQFAHTENTELLAYARGDGRPDGDLLVVVNLDAGQRQCGMVSVPLEFYGLSEDDAYRVCDVFTGETWEWTGRENWVDLDPAERVAHIFHLERISP